MSSNNTELSAASVIVTLVFAVALIFLGAWLISDGLANSLEEGVSFVRTLEVLSGLYLVFGSGRRE